MCNLSLLTRHSIEIQRRFAGQGVDAPQDYINERDWVEWMTEEEEKEAISQLNELVPTPGNIHTT